MTERFEKLATNMFSEFVSFHYTDRNGWRKCDRMENRPVVDLERSPRSPDPRLTFAGKIGLLIFKPRNSFWYLFERYLLYGKNRKIVRRLSIIIANT